VGGEADFEGIELGTSWTLVPGPRRREAAP